MRTAFLGFVNQSELPAVYAAADLLVLPSNAQETWGLVVNEAMACGTPAVVSDAVGCGPDLVDAGATGAIFPFGDIAGLAAAIDGVFSLDRAHVRRRLADKMARYSPQHAAAAIVEAAATLAKQFLANVLPSAAGRIGPSFCPRIPCSGSRRNAAS